MGTNIYKVIFFTAALSFFTLSLYAQTLQNAKDFYSAKQYEKAMTAIDDLLKASPTVRPATLLWKHKIYWAIANDAQLKNKYPDATIQGFEALKKAAYMPGGDEALLIELGFDFTKAFTDYYTGFINTGSDKMNAEKFSESLEYFKSAIAVSTYFYDKKLVTADLDTMVNFYAGYMGMKAGKNNEAEYYFKKLTDKNASGTDLQIAYGWLTNYYLETKKDIPAAKAVYEKGIRFYPDDAYLKSMNILIARKSGNPEDIFKSYEKTIAAGSAAFEDYLSYGAELYDYLYVDNASTGNNTAAKETRMFEMLNNALKLNPKSAETNYILGMSYTSQAMAADKQLKEIKGLTPADVIKKKQLRTTMNDNTALSVKFLEATRSIYEAKATLKPAEKEHYKTALAQLINLYKYLEQPDNLKIIEEQLKKAG